jgi:hypothetical protein
MAREPRDEMTLPGFGKHCSDESLAALLDGELSDRQKRRVCRHLEACWLCRARQNELQNTILELARAFETQHLLTSERLSTAWKRLRSRMSAELPPPRPFRWRRLSLLAAGATALLLLPFVGSRHHSGNPVPRPPMDRTIATDPSSAPSAPMHQRVVVDLQKIGPVRETLRGTLDVWSAGANPRRSFRWQDQRGKTRWGLWQTDSRRAEQHSVPELRPARYHADRLGELCAHWSDLREGEHHWTTWLAHRDREPLELLAEWLRLLREDGFRLRARAVNGSMVLLKADKLSAGRHLEAWLELDQGGRHARLLGLRWETPAATWQMVLHMATEERIAPNRIPADVFVPVHFRASRPTPPARRATALAPLPWEEDTEIDALYALHLHGACLGEPIFLEEDRGGWRVSGTVRDDQRKRALEDTLASIRGLHVEIRSLAEAAVAARPSAPAAPVLLPDSDPPARPELIAAGESPVEEQLRAHFGSAPAIAEFCRAQVTDADRALEEAWAIRRLEERFQNRASLLSPRARLLLDRMKKDHEDALNASLDRLSAGLSGVFGIQTGPGDVNLDRFHRIERLTRVVHALFAGDKAAQADADALNELFTLLKTNIGRLAQ